MTAIETALTGPFEFHVRSDLHLKSLRAETPGAWITMRFDEDLDAAAKAALRDMIELIRERGKAVRSGPMKSPDNAAASRESITEAPDLENRARQRRIT